MRKLLAMVLVVALGPGLTAQGCKVELARLTVVSTKNVELSRIDMARLGVTKGLEGTDTRWFILGLPVGPISLEEAIDRLEDAGRGDFVTNAIVSYWRWEFLLFGWDTVFVQGDVLNSRERPAYEAFPSPSASARESTGPRGVAPPASAGGVRGAGR